MATTRVTRLRQLFALTCIFWQAKGRPVPVEAEWTEAEARKRCTRHCPYWKNDGRTCELVGGSPTVIELKGMYKPLSRRRKF